MKKNIGIILLVCSFLLSCIGKQNKENYEGNTSEEAIETGTSLDSVSITDSNSQSLRILSRQSLSLTGDSIQLDIRLDEINAYFETADTIPADMALSRLQSYNKRYS